MCKKISPKSVNKTRDSNVLNHMVNALARLRIIVNHEFCPQISAKRSAVCLMVEMFLSENFITVKGGGQILK